MNYFTEPSFIRLIVINIITIILAVWQNWGLIPLLYIFWGQSVIIGIFNAIEIFTLKNFSTENFKMNGRPIENTKSAQRSVGLFFCVHYGFFHFMYFIFIPFVAALGKKEWGDSFDADDFRMAFFSVVLNIVLFFISYLIDYRYKHKHYSLTPNIGTLMFFPYIRVFPLHAVIIFAFFMGSKNSLLLFLSLKLLADAGMHIVDRMRYKNAVFIE